jgi:hypothetical protein
MATTTKVGDWKKKKKVDDSEPGSQDTRGDEGGKVKKAWKKNPPKRC